MAVILYKETQWQGTTSDAPLALGTIDTYVAGTSTPLATYTNGGGLTIAANPLVLDAYGRANSGDGIWLTEGSTYKFVVKNAAGTTIHTIDNISTDQRTNVTVSAEATLSSSRRLTAGAGMALVDAGANSTLTVNLAPAAETGTTITVTTTVSANSLVVGSGSLIFLPSASLAVSATANALAVTGTWQNLAPTADYDINGMVAKPVGTIVKLVNTSTLYTLTINSENVGAVAENRFISSHTITPGYSRTFIYLSTLRWSTLL